MKSVKKLFSFLFVLVSVLSYSQDVIIKQDSTKIFCRIIKQDSLSIYYALDKDKSSIELSINKTYVLKCYTNTSGLIFESNSIDPISIAKPKKESSQVKNDFIIKTNNTKIFCKITKEDSGLIYYIAKGNVELIINKSEVYKYYNSAVGVMKMGSVFQSQTKSDSIILINKTYFYQGNLVTRRNILKLMEKNKEASQEMEKAANSYGYGRLIGSIAGVIAGDATANLILGKPNGLVVLGVGAGLVLLTIPFQYYYKKHLHKAIKLYNSKTGIAVTKTPKFQLVAASSGIGLCLKF